MKGKNKGAENYLERKPRRRDGLNWSSDDAGMVTLEIENKGVMNRIAQTLLRKPRVSFVHLDETGSFLWPLLDGEKDLCALGEELEARFGEKAHPLYERLAKFCQILDSYGFITWN